MSSTCFALNGIFKSVPKVFKEEESPTISFNISNNFFIELSLKFTVMFENGMLYLTDDGNVVPIVPLAGIAMIVLVAFAIALIVFFLILLAYRTKKAKYEVLKTAIENGRELPPDFFNEPQKEQKKGSALRKGVIWAMAGIGLFIALLFSTDILPDGMSGIAYSALIPFFIGIGYLIIYFIEKAEGKKQKEEGI